MKSCPHLLELMKEEHVISMISAFPGLKVVEASSERLENEDVDSVEFFVENIQEGLYFNSGDEQWRFDVESNHQPLPKDSARLVELRRRRMLNFSSGEPAVDGSVYGGFLVGEIPGGLANICQCGQELMTESEVQSAGYGRRILVFKCCWSVAVCYTS